MRVPIAWLAEYVDLPRRGTVGRGPRRRARPARARGRGVAPPGAVVTGPLVVGRVLEIEELTEFKKPIRYCQVDVGRRPDAARGIVCGATQLRRRRPGGRRAARRRPARRLRDRRAQDLRPRLRRHDLLGPRAGHRRGPRRHPGAAAGHAPTRATTPRRAARAWTTPSSSSPSRPTAATACRCAASPASWHRPRRRRSRDPGAGYDLPAPTGDAAGRCGSPTRAGCDRFVAGRVDRPRPDRAHALVDAPPAAAVRASARSRWPSTSPTT